MATASPSSAPERRGQASPTAALIAVAAIGLGLSLYATVFAGVGPTADRNVAEPTLSRVHDVVAPAGVADPDRLDAARDAGPAGWTLRIELRAGGRQWAAGDAQPGARRTTSAGRRVAVRTSPGRVLSGRLRVVVRR